MKPEYRLDITKLYFACVESTVSSEDVFRVLHDWNLPSDTLVHASHCKVECGCKYLDDYCPVINGKVKQIFDYDPEWD